MRNTEKNIIDNIAELEFEAEDYSVLNGISAGSDHYSQLSPAFHSREELGELAPILEEVFSPEFLEEGFSAVGVANVSFFKERKGYPLTVEPEEAEEVVVSVRFHARAEDVESLQHLLEQREAQRIAEMNERRTKLQEELNELNAILGK